MRTLYDPVTMMVALAGAQFVGGIMQGQAAKSQADSEAQFLDMQAEQERKQARRDAEDLKRQEDHQMGRTRALLAAGGGTTEGSDLAILTSTAESYARGQHRIEDDAYTRTTTLNMKASATRKAGNAAQRNAIFGGTMKAGSTLYSMPGAK